MSLGAGSSWYGRLAPAARRLKGADRSWIGRSWKPPRAKSFAFAKSPPLIADIRADAQEVMVRYCRAIDSHDAAALHAILSPDVRLSVGEERRSGRDNVVTLLSSLFESREWARHSLSNMLVRLDEHSEVVLTSYFQFVIASAVRTLGLGEYEATMRLENGELLLTSLHVVIIDSFELER